MQMRMKQGLIWGAAALATVLAGSAAYLYFVSTDAALRRAEAFQFRRMQVARVGEGDSLRFFFATNRTDADPGAGPARVDSEPQGPRFGPARQAGRLTLGTFDSEVEPSLGLWIWLDAGARLLDEEIRIRAVRALDRAEALRQVRAMVAASPHRALLILVHGFRTDFDSALRGTAFLAHILDIDAPVMVFDWPADQGDSLGGYRRARRVADESAAELAEALKLAAREIRPDRLWLVANSLGAQVAVEAVRRLHGEGGPLGGPILDELVLTAPDVDRASFDGGLKGKLAALVGRTTVYVSSNDRALLVSRVVNRAARLGESTLRKSSAAAAPEPAPDPSDESEEVEAVLALMEPQGEGPGAIRSESRSPGAGESVSLVDATPVNRTRNFHSFSLEVPEYFDDLFLRLTNAEVPENRLRYRMRTPGGKVYSVLTRGR
jgi:pimeloyl-ACP methyl ester carboxylesterase